MSPLEERSPAKTGTVRTLQAMRGLAALLVVIQHAESMWWGDILHSQPPFAMNGTVGVDLFFVISGFIMPLSIHRYESRSKSAKQFLKRRLERVVPLYWLCTLFKLIMLLLLPAVSESGLGSVQHVVLSFLFLPSFDALGEIKPLLQLGWTLNFEMYFYLLICIALAMGARLRHFLPPALLMVSMGYFLKFPQNYPIDREHLPLMAEFLLGLVLAWRFRRRKVGVGFTSPWITVPAFFIALYLMLFVGQVSLLAFFFVGPLAMIVIGAGLEMEDWIGLKLPRFLLLLGDASYSIYLTHWFLVTVVRKIMQLPQLAGVHTFTIPLAMMLSLSAGVGILVYHFVESPINRYFRVRRRTATGM